MLDPRFFFTEELAKKWAAVERELEYPTQVSFTDCGDRDVDGIFLRLFNWRVSGLKT